MDRVSRLFRFNNIRCVRAYSIMFHVAGLSLRDLSERYCMTMASRESVRRWFLERLGLKYRYQRFGLRNAVQRFSGYLKQRTKRFYNNINTLRIKSMEDYASTIAIIRKLLITMKTQGGVLPGRQDQKLQ